MKKRYVTKYFKSDKLLNDPLSIKKYLLRGSNLCLFAGSTKFGEIHCIFDSEYNILFERMVGSHFNTVSFNVFFDRIKSLCSEHNVLEIKVY